MSRVLVYCCPLLGVVQPAASRGKSARKTQKHFLSGSWSYDFSRAKMISPSSRLWEPCHSMLVIYVYFCTGVMILGVLQFSHPFCLGCLGHVCCFTCIPASVPRDVLDHRHQRGKTEQNPFFCGCLGRAWKLFWSHGALINLWWEDIFVTEALKSERQNCIWEKMLRSDGD